MTLHDSLMALYEEDHHTNRTEFQRGAMNYMGSKFNGLAQILPRIPLTGKFIDVFGGSGVVTLNMPVQKFEVYNDKHSGLVAFYRTIAQEGGPQALRERIGLMPHSRELWYTYKRSKEEDKSELERAAQWYYLVQASVLGRGDAFGRDLKGANSVWRKIHEQLELFPIIHQRFRGVLIENLDYKQVMKDFDSFDAAFYLDPPYWESDVYECKMDKLAHIQMCQAIFEAKGFVALSGYSNPVYDEFPWDAVHQIVMDNRVENNVDGSTEKERIEWLWIKEHG